MESQATPDPASAQAELAGLRARRAALAERVVQPWWYDALLGLLVFGFLGSYATHQLWLVAGAAVIFFGGLRGLAAVYTRLTGIWLNGDRPGRTQVVLRVWLAFCIGWVVVALVEVAMDVRGLVLPASAVCGVAAAVLSRWWTRIYVAELRGEL